jgi:hypothetical protein
MTILLIQVTANQMNPNMKILKRVRIQATAAQAAQAVVESKQATRNLLERKWKRRRPRIHQNQLLKGRERKLMSEFLLTKFYPLCFFSCLNSFRLEQKMKKLAISKKKQEESKNEEKENNNPHSDSEEEIITEPIKIKKRAKKIKNEDYMNNEKEKYLSRLANVADLISSSSSEPDDKDDDEFEINEIQSESDSHSSDNENSFIRSSQVSSNKTPSSSDTTSYLSESYYDKEHSGKKSLSYVSSLSSKRKVH